MNVMQSVLFAQHEDSTRRDLYVQDLAGHPFSFIVSWIRVRNWPDPPHLPVPISYPGNVVEHSPSFAWLPAEDLNPPRMWRGRLKLRLDSRLEASLVMPQGVALPPSILDAYEAQKIDYPTAAHAEGVSLVQLFTIGHELWPPCAS